MALSDRQILRARPKGAPYKLYDIDGLYLLVSASGSKLWRLNYRHNGKWRTLAIGKYPEISLAEAREETAKARKLLAAGKDPSEEKRAARRAAILAARNTFGVIAREYLDGLAPKGLAPVTIRKNRWILEELIIPKIGSRPIDELRASDILAVLKDIEASGRLETARRARQVIGAVFKLATLTDRASGDPTPLLHRALRSPTVTSHPAIIHEESFGKLLQAIDSLRSRVVRNALLFHALTFPRPVELRLMDWEHVDLEEGVWRIPAEHTKMRRPHDVPIVFQSLAILREMAQITGRRSGPVFPSPVGLRGRISENTLNHALWKLGYKGKHTAHGFRSSASTILNERGYRVAVIETQLNHLEEDETKRAYNRAQYWDERVAMMRDWGELIERLRRGG